MEFIRPIDINKNLDKYFIVDIREDYEYEEANIGSLHIPMGEIEDRIEELKTEKTIAILCRSGRRAEAVSNLLENDFKMTNVCIVDGGILAWKEEVDSSLTI